MTTQRQEEEVRELLELGDHWENLSDAPEQKTTTLEENT
jgi:hypothetical protein